MLMIVMLTPRIILLYATREEAARLLEWARERELTGHDYVWIVTQSVIGESRGGVAPTKPQFPVGMLGEYQEIEYQGREYQGIEYQYISKIYTFTITPGLSE